MPVDAAEIVVLVLGPKHRGEHRSNIDVRDFNCLDVYIVGAGIGQLRFEVDAVCKDRLNGVTLEFPNFDTCKVIGREIGRGRAAERQRYRRNRNFGCAQDGERILLVTTLEYRAGKAFGRQFRYLVILRRRSSASLQSVDLRVFDVDTFGRKFCSVDVGNSVRRELA